MWGLLFAAISLYTGISILTDPNCDSVALTGGGSWRALLTCYQAGMEGGIMSGTTAGMIIILLALAMGFVGFMSLFR